MTHNDDPKHRGLGALLLRVSSGVFVVRVLGQALMLGLMVFLARVLGAAEFSTYVYVLAWLNVGVLAAKLGLDSTVLRFSASYVATQAWGKLAALLRWSNRWVLLASGLGAALVAALVWAFGSDPETSATAIWACAVVPVLSLAALRGAALQGLQRVVRSQLPELVLRPLAQGTLVAAAVYVAGVDLDPSNAMQLYLIAVATSFAVGALWLTRALPSEVRTAPPEPEPRAWLSTGLSLLLVSGSFRVITQTDTIMVGALLEETDAGIYYAASRLAQLVNFGIVAIQGIAAPLISSLYARGERAQLQRLLRLSALGALGVASAATIVLVVFGELALQLFGSTFELGYGSLVILCVAQLLSAAMGMTGLSLSMTGRHRAAAIIVGSAAVANIGLNAAFVPWLGRDGAALATLCATVAWNVAAAIYLWRSAGLLTLAVPWSSSREVPPASSSE